VAVPTLDPAELRPRRVLLASEGRAISGAALELAVRLAAPDRAPVHVFSIARVWGTSLGLPTPGLLPSKRDWDAQRRIVSDAVKALRRRGVKADGHVLGTRKATKRIVGEATRLECDVIVMGADPPRSRLLADFMWSQEPYRVRRRARVPVYLALEDAGPARQGRRRG
jgi:nucleotide-binding universal stress UspA family protein